MIRLAVATRAETFDRMREPLAMRGIEVVHVDVEERAIALSADASPWADRAFDVGYVYPPRVMEGGVADAILDIPWINDRDDVLRSRNKAAVLATLARADIDVPTSVLVSNPVDEETLVEVFDGFDGPVVVKPNSTTRGVGVARAEDLDSFLGIVDYIDLVHDFRATGDKSFVVQRFVPDALDLRVMVIDGTYVGAVERQLPADARASDRWKHNVHRGATATAVSVEPPLRSLAERVASILSIPILGVDFLLSNSRALVSETNARPTIDVAEKYEPDFYDRLTGLIQRTAP